MFLSALLGSNHFTVNLHQWFTKLIRIAQTHAHTFSPSSGLPKKHMHNVFSSVSLKMAIILVMSSSL